MNKRPVAGFVVTGALVGGFLGFLLRPSVPLIGQLPWETVLNRGANLSGLDMLLKSTAEESFNFLVVGAILGAACLWVVRLMIPHSAALVPAPLPIAPQGGPFCHKCGAQFGDAAGYCAKCGAQRS